MNKQLLLSAVAMASFLGSNAQTKTIEASTADNLNHQYRLVNYAKGDGYNPTRTWIGRDLEQALDADGANFSFISAGSEGDYYIYLVNKGQYLYYTDVTEGGGKVKLSSTEKSKFKATKTTANTNNHWGTGEGYLFQPYFNTEVQPVYLNLMSEGLGFYGKKSNDDNGNVWCVTAIKASFFTYVYTCNGEVWYKESNVRYIDQDSPEFTVPYGVTVKVPRFTISESTVGNIEIPVEYDKKERGFEFSKSFDEAVWCTWHKRYSYNNQVDSQFKYEGQGEAVKQQINSEVQYGDAYLWAAVGNPYSFKIVNKKAGSELVLCNPSSVIRDQDQPTMQKRDSGRAQNYFLSYQYSPFNQWGDYSFQVLDANVRTALNGNGLLNYWVDAKSLSDDGSLMKLVEVPAEILTGIDNVSVKENSGFTYNIDGQISGNNNYGIYIQGGSKILKK